MKGWWPRSAATRIGVSLDQYQRRRAAGDAWCSACQAWHPETAFARRADGRLMSACPEGHRAASRAAMARMRTRRGIR